jgi:hypothetical protein
MATFGIGSGIAGSGQNRNLPKHACSKPVSGTKRWKCPLLAISSRRIAARVIPIANLSRNGSRSTVRDALKEEGCESLERRRREKAGSGSS